MSEKHRLNKTMLLSFCEAEASGHEREQHTRRQLLIPSPHLGITVPSAVTRVNHVTVFGQTLGLESGGTE